MQILIKQDSGVESIGPNKIILKHGSNTLTDSELEEVKGYNSVKVRIANKTFLIEKDGSKSFEPKKVERKEKDLAPTAETVTVAIGKKKK